MLPCHRKLFNHHIQLMKHILTAAMLLLFTWPGVRAQSAQAFEVPTTNPAAMIEQRVAATTITVSYHRPTVQGRIIFGALVPYGEVWRTGADAATRISFSTPVEIMGTEVDSGTYELFTIPGKSEWVVILQKSSGQWGSYAYNPEHDLARFHVTPDVLHEQVESFTISIDDVRASSAILHLSWDLVRVPLRIEIDLQKTVVPQIEAALASAERKPYFRAAMFYYENDLDIDRAAELMQKALEANPDHIGMRYRQALILEKKGDFAGARQAAELSLAGAMEAGPELKREYTRLNTLLLERLPK